MTDTVGEIYDSENFVSLQEWLGERPGNYFVDKFYLRRGHSHKPYFWNPETKKWELIRIGDRFYIDEDGLPVREPRK